MKDKFAKILKEEIEREIAIEKVTGGYSVVFPILTDLFSEMNKPPKEFMRTFYKDPVKFLVVENARRQYEIFIMLAYYNNLNYSTYKNFARPCQLKL